MAAINDLNHLLEQDLQQLDRLVQLLEQEKAVLGSADIKALQALTTEKDALLGDIRERARQKIRLLVAIGYRPDLGEPSRFLRGAGLNDTFSLWIAAKAGLERCQDLNAGNGKVIGHLQKRLGRLTDIFRGTSEQPKLYGAKGQQTGLGGSSILASA
ncbi:flagella synthesis protein FlgN [Marinobacter sp. C2H3]|uniref:flagella synthesis protein FlgN n=1 Tax=Marinobacter sp. C2H3 TaxID=3119003 RepID=UPI00300EC1EC